MIGQAEEFLAHGFDGFMSKPIQTARLNAILCKHIRDKQPPEVLQQAAQDGNAARNIQEYQGNSALLARLRADFVRSHKHTAEAMRQAISGADYHTARHLAHNVKGLAGLIHEASLTMTAGEMEAHFTKGENPPQHLCDTFDEQISRVLAAISDVALPTVLPGDILPPQGAIEILNKLQPLLESQNVAATEYLDDLRRIPGGDELYTLIEEFDFTGGVELLKTLRIKMEDEL
jgi:HPt (histidine-containing phosphotransfer) domain-containing protein